MVCRAECFNSGAGRSARYVAVGRPLWSTTRGTEAIEVSLSSEERQAVEYFHDSYQADGYSISSGSEL